MVSYIQLCRQENLSNKTIILEKEHIQQSSLCDCSQSRIGLELFNSSQPKRMCKICNLPPATLNSTPTALQTRVLSRTT